MGAGASDNCSVTLEHDNLAGGNVAVRNVQASSPVNATLNWWGSLDGPTGIGASTVVGNVNFSPWLGDAASITLPTPDALGFTAGQAYVVTPNTTGPGSPSLSIALAANPSPLGTVTPAGTFVIAGSGGSVTINGESGTGYSTDDFVMNNHAVAFAAADAFKGAKVELNGNNIGLTVAGQGTTNGFNVSGWTGAGTLTAPTGTGTVAAAKNAGSTLTDTSLASTDGMNVTLSGITSADLSTVGAGVGDIVDASPFTGVANLNAGGTGSAIFYGAEGGGKLTVTGSGNNVLIGGPGGNTLTDTGTGRNILIGGGGPNTITGNGHDILISGTTTYDAQAAPNIAALDAILAVWSDANLSYMQRWTKINQGFTVGSNSYALNLTTVKSNGKSNTIMNGTLAAPKNWLLVTYALDSFTALGQAATNVPL